MNAPQPAPDTLLSQRALSGHAAIGLLAGALLYLVLLTGSIAVIHERLLRWEAADAPHVDALGPTQVQRALAAAFQTPGKPRSATLYLQLPDAAARRAVAYNDAGAHVVTADGAIAGKAHTPWTEFLLALHINLNLPAAFGLVVVGILGVMMTALSFTGVLALPRIARDAFLLRARGQRKLAQADWHNRLGTWTLPFALAVALTGAFFGLASLGSMLVARSYHGGDIGRTYAPVFGDFVGHDARPAPLADVGTAMREMSRHFPDVEPTFVTVVGPGTMGQRVMILAEVPRRLIYGENYIFDAAGRFRGTTGLADGRLGQQAAASVYKLHFGNFGGLPVELAYVALGLAVTVIAGTGMSLWLQKRSRRGLASVRLEAFWAMVVWGSPIALIGAYWGTRVLPAAIDPAATFWGLLALGIVAAMARPATGDRIRLRRVAAVMTGVTGVAHAAIATSGTDTLLIDAALIMTGVAIWLPRGGIVQRRDRRALV